MELPKIKPIAYKGKSHTPPKGAGKTKPGKQWPPRCTPEIDFREADAEPGTSEPPSAPDHLHSESRPLVFTFAFDAEQYSYSKFIAMLRAEYIKQLSRSN